MKNLLVEWLNTTKNELESRRFVVTLNNDEAGTCTSVDVDSERFIATICFWEQNRFEFQLTDCDSGEVRCIETVELNSVAEVSTFFNAFLEKLKLAR